MPKPFRLHRHLDRLRPPSAALGGLPISPFPRRRDPSGLRPHYIRERSWPVAGRFALCLPAQRLEDLLGGDRYFIDAHAHGVDEVPITPEKVFKALRRK